MVSPPSTPPRNAALKCAAAHLHQRTSSKIALVLSPPTPPHGGASSTAYRIIPESPSSLRLMSPPSKRGVSVQPLSWGKDKLQAKKLSGFWTKRRVVILAGLVLSMLLVARRPAATEPIRRDRGSGGDLEQATYGQGNMRSPLNKVQAQEMQGKLEPVKLYPAPHQQHAPGARPVPPGRFHKVPARLGKADAGAGEHDLAAPPSHNFEVTSATDPDSMRRFMLVGWMGEQETKAQQHLYQLGLLSLPLNRTLVLPTVKRSRFGSCFSQPFSLYYAEDTLSRFGIPFITSDKFWAWAERQRSTPSAQIVTLNRENAAPSEIEGVPLERLCLSQRALDFDDFERKTFFAPNHEGNSATARERFGVEVVQALLEQERVPGPADGVRTPSVLVADVHLRYPFLSPSSVSRLSPFDFKLPTPYSYFDYSSHWTALGETIASSLSPFVGVHWRTETLPVETLLPCGDALVASLDALKREHPEIQTVYLATDYPLEVVRGTADSDREESATAHSGTMTKTLTPAHHAAMRAFLEKIEGSAFRVTTFMEEQQRVALPEELQKAVGNGALQDLDGAIVGIVDKIVLMQAEVFYAGLPVTDSPQGCAKLSQFTTQVINGRQERKSQGRNSTEAWVDVEHFALAGGRKKRQGAKKHQ